jgi:hypothetical protein
MDYIMNAAYYAQMMAILALAGLAQMLFLFRPYPCLIASVHPVS